LAFGKAFSKRKLDHEPVFYSLTISAAYFKTQLRFLLFIDAEVLKKPE